MIDFFIYIYVGIPKLPIIRRVLSLQRGVRGGMRLLLNWLVELWFFFSRPFMSIGIDKNECFIVSLTSFPARIGTVSRCVETLLRQKKKPKFVVLWLSLDQFPDKSSLPKSLLRQEKRGLRIELRKGDIRSHKKYFYAFGEYRDLNVITVDDDVLYSSNLTQNLCCIAEKKPGVIIGNQVKKISVKNGKIERYLNWASISFDGKHLANVPIGAGGVFYPANISHEDFRNIDVFMGLAPRADDLWLGILAMYLSIPVIPSGKEELEQIPLTIFSDEALFSTNAIGGNDIQLDNILNWVHRELGRDLRQEIILKNS